MVEICAATRFMGNWNDPTYRAEKSLPLADFSLDPDRDGFALGTRRGLIHNPSTKYRVSTRSALARVTISSGFTDVAPLS